MLFITGAFLSRDVVLVNSGLFSIRIYKAARFLLIQRMAFKMAE